MTTVSVVGTCHHDCPDTCGWVATAADGVLTKLRGNPDHPYSAGELCPKVNRFVARVNDPDRLLTPLIRTGPKGQGQFRKATWDEALDTVVGRFEEVRQRFGGEAILPWSSAGTQGLLQENSISRVFFAHLGSSRQTGSICGQAAAHGMAATYGAPLGADALNLEHAELIVLWGTNTRLTNRHLWPTIERARAAGARLVVIDPIRTMTADSADDFIQPLPGTDVALVLAVLHVVIGAGLIDQEYIDAHALGFDELAAHVATCSPEWASAITGLDPEVITTFALDYGRAEPAMIRALIGAEHHENGAMFYRAVSCLPVVTGSWRHLGGGVSRSVGAWPALADVTLAPFDEAVQRLGGVRRGLGQPQLGRHLTDRDLEPPIAALMVWNGNPAVSMPNSRLIRTGLMRDDLFTVVSEQFMTDTARYADVVFPATTQVEQLDVVPAWGHLWLGWNEPAIEPMGQSVPNTELFRRLARAGGFDDPLFEKSDEELLDLALGPDVDRETLRREGFVRVKGTEQLMPYAEGGFHTASGKAELASSTMESMGQPRLPTFVPTIEGADGPSGDFDLVLVTPKQHVRFLNTSYSGSAGHADREAEPTLEIDPHDALARDLADGDRAEVFNRRGQIELRVRYSDRLRPGVVSIPWGWWAGHYGGHEAVVNDLTNDAATDWGGGAAYGDTRVGVRSIR